MNYTRSLLFNRLFKAIFILGIVIILLGMPLVSLMKAPEICEYFVFFGGMGISVLGFLIARRICICKDGPPLPYCLIHHHLVRD